MATVVIDVLIKTRTDTSGAEKAKKATEDVGKAASGVSKKKHSVRLGVEDNATRGIQKVMKSAASFGKKTFKATLSIIDKASDIILNADTKIKAFTSKTWQTTLSVVDKFTSPLTKLKNALFSINTLITTVATGLATKFVISDPVNMADTVESSQIAFESLLGSTEAANQMMGNVMQFAKDTPFDTQGVVDGVKQMLVYGIASENVLDYMEKIGNATAALGTGTQGIEAITRALGQMKSKNRVSAEEMLQLTEAGVKAWDYLAKGQNVSVAEVQEMVEDGLIPAEKAIQSIVDGMSEFDGVMEQTSNRTVKGLLSNIKDAFDQSIVLKWGKGLQKGATKGLENFKKWLERIDPMLTQLGTSLEDLGEKLSTYIFDKLEGLQNRFEVTIGTPEFKEADLTGKIKILWNDVIWKPFSDWWESEGKEKICKKMEELGSSIGTGLSNFLTVLFGGANSAIDDGASIGASFAQGFLAGFNGEQVSEAIISTIKGGFSSLGTVIFDNNNATAGDYIKGGLTAFGLYKGAVGAAKIGKGVVKAGNFAKQIWGSPAGTGLASKFASIGTSLAAKGGTALAGGSAAAAAAGTGAVLGGVVGGVSAIKGVSDLFLAKKYRDEGNITEAEAKTSSGGKTLTGVTLGATTGAMIGSAIPGIGTAIGGLIGAGVGGIAGWIWGEKDAERIRKEAEAAKYESVEMQEAIKNSEIEAEELAKKFEEAVNTNISEHFGNLALTMEEISTYAQDVVFGDKINDLNAFASAVTAVETSFNQLRNATDSLNKWTWKASSGIVLDEDDKQAMLESVNTYIESAEQYIEDKHFEISTAVSLLVDTESEDGSGIITGVDNYYSALKNELTEKGREFADQLEIYLDDGILSLSEEQELNNLREQINEITQKFSNAETEAELETIKIKFTGGQIDSASFAALQSELQAQVNESSATYQQALTTSITSLKLQLDDGALTQEEYDLQLQTLINGYNANIDNLNAQVTGVQLEILGDAYEDVLGEDAKTKLQGALDKAVKEGISPLEWTAEETAKIFGIDSISEESATAINGFLSQVVNSLSSSFSEEDMSVISSANGNAIGNALANTDMEPINNAVDSVYTETNTAIQTAFDTEFSAQSKVNITLDYNILNPTANLKITGNGASGSTTITAKADQNAAGGYIGSKTLSWLAEEGTPEMVIPLGAHRRQRGIALWLRTGEMLGVTAQKHANGGLVGHSNGSAAPLSLPYASQASTVTVNVGGVSFNISNANNAEELIAAIRQQSGELVNIIVDKLVDGLTENFENTPLAVIS